MLSACSVNGCCADVTMLLAAGLDRASTCAADWLAQCAVCQYVLVQWSDAFRKVYPAASLLHGLLLLPVVMPAERVGSLHMPLSSPLLRWHDIVWTWDLCELACLYGPDRLPCAVVGLEQCRMLQAGLCGGVRLPACATSATATLETKRFQRALLQRAAQRDHRLRGGCCTGADLPQLWQSSTSATAL